MLLRAVSEQVLIKVLRNTHQILPLLLVLRGAAHEFDPFPLFLHSEQLNLTKGLSLDASSKAPAISLDGQHGKLDTDLSSPAINGTLPNLSVNNPSLSVGSQFSKPSFGITGPDVQAGSDGSLTVPEISAPQLKAPSASLDIKNPDVKTGSLKYEPPKFSMPSFNLPQINPESQMGISGDTELPSVHLDSPNLNLDPNLGLKGPKAGLTGPNLDVNGPGVNLQSPEVDLDGYAGKFKWPHQKWKGPKGKALDADLSAPELSVSTPGVKANVDTPSVDLNSPRVDADPPSGKIMWPHLKWKKPKGPNADLDLEANLNTPELSAPKLESDLSAPDIDLKVPKAELKGPDVDVQSPDINVDPPSGKINWPHLKWKKPRGSKADLDLDADLTTPDVNLSAPHLEGEMNVPNAELELPKAGANVQMPDADIDAPSAKINWPHLKWKKPKVHGPKADVDLNADLSAPDVDVSVPDVNADINTPDIGLSLPNADMKAPNLDVDPPSSKIKWPTLKKPKIKKDHNLEVSTPDLEIDKPDVNLNMPKADLEAPELDVSAPDIDGPSGKLKWFHFKKPKFGTLKGPKADLDADLKAPDMDLRGPDVDLKTPGIDLSTPKIEGKIGDPELDVGMPDVNLSGPDVDSSGVAFPDGKLNLSKLKLPNFSGPTVKGPELNADVNAPTFDASPSVNLKAPNLSVATPDLDIAAPTMAGNLNTPAPSLDVNLNKDITAPNANFTLPDLDLSPSMKGPNVALNGDLSAPSLPTPTIGELKAPDVHLNMQKPDLEAPELHLDAPDAEGPSGKFKWFNFKKPKFGTLKGEKAQIDAEMKPPDVDLKGPDLNLNQASPELNGNISLPDIDATLPKGNLSAPDFSIKAPKVDLPTADLNGPGTQVQTPGIALDSHLGDFKMPQLRMPAVQAGLEGPKVSSGTLDSSIAATAADVSVKAPQVSTPELNVASDEGADVKSSPKGKLRWPFKWGFKSGSGTDEEGNGYDSETEATNNLVPSFKLHKLPEMNLDSPAGIREAFSLSRQDSESKDYVVSKGIRLPVVNATSKPGEKVNIFERLQMAKRKSSDSLANAEGGGSSLERGGTFKVDPLESGLSLVAPEIPALNDDDKLSFGLSNMLCLNVKDSKAN